MRPRKPESGWRWRNGKSSMYGVSGVDKRLGWIYDLDQKDRWGSGSLTHVAANGWLWLAGLYCIDGFEILLFPCFLVSLFPCFFISSFSSFHSPLPPRFPLPVFFFFPSLPQNSPENGL